MRFVGLHRWLTVVGPFFLAAGLAAQTTGTAVFQGQILDERAETPVRGVLIRLDTGAEMVTGEDGRFRLTSLEAGRHIYALLTEDCQITWGEVVLGSAATYDAKLTVASSFDTDAAAEQESSRRSRSKGKFVTGAEIDAMHAVSMIEVIRRVAPTMVMGAPEEAGAVTRLTSRGNNSIVSASVPIVVIDGMRLEDGARALSNIRPSQVESLEILPGAAGGWEYGSSGSGGVIKVTTGRSGPVRGAEKKACIVPDFPGH